MESHHPFFRAKAMQEYIQRQEKDILPRFLSPYITILAYLLLALLLLLGLLTWWGEAPLLVTGAGIVLTNESTGTAGNSSLAIVLFFPVSEVSQLHVGEETDMFVEPAGHQFSSTIQYIETKAVSSVEVRQRYLLPGSAAQLIPPSSVAAILLPPATNGPYLETGDFVSAQVHAGSQHILSFCLGLHDATNSR